MTDASTIIPLGREPITEENPVGNPVDEERLDWFKTEIGKAQSVHGEVINWNAMIAIAVQILQKQSKDLRIAGYLCRALTAVHSHSGLNVGLAVLQDLLTHYWEDAYPVLTRPQRRTTMLAWLDERVVAGLQPKDPPEIPQCQAILKQLDFIAHYFNQKLANETPYFAALKHYYQDILEALQNPPPEPEAEPQTEETAPPDNAESATEDTKADVVVEAMANVLTPADEDTALTPEKIKALRTGLDQYATFFDKTIPQLMANRTVEDTKK